RPRFRAATSLDICTGQPELGIWNFQLHVTIHVLYCRTTLEWTVQTKPFIRVPARQSSTDAPKRNSMLDALDLTYNFRGCGWDWSQGLYVPPETHPTSSRLAFAISALISGLKHSFIFGVAHCAIQSFSPDTFGSVNGGTIFDYSLPPHLRYLRSTIITTLCTLFVYSVFQANYELTAPLGVLLFKQHPDQWPPSFDSPWRATSVREFWSRRWHQRFRRLFIFLGKYPLSLLFGRAGALAVDPSSEMWRSLLPFGMMGVGMVIERAVAGNKTGGWIGWIWTMCWLVLWGNMIVDGWARTGVLGGSTILDSVTPVRQPIERLVRMFDEYLHAC
ncbi:hypothetical protein BDR07DRAFT_1394044, partial [Suillus spraguei]